MILCLRHSALDTQFSDYCINVKVHKYLQDSKILNYQLTLVL